MKAALAAKAAPAAHETHCRLMRRPPVEAGFADPRILGTFIGEAAFPYPVAQINPC
jgi:hypothetical protein